MKSISLKLDFKAFAWKWGAGFFSPQAFPQKAFLFVGKGILMKKKKIKIWFDYHHANLHFFPIKWYF